MHKIELDNKEYNFPASVNELTLGMYEKIQTIVLKQEDKEFTYDSVIDIITALTGIDKEIILNAPTEFFDQIYKLCEWVFFLDLTALAVKTEIEVNGEKYTYNESANITLKEWVDIDAVLRQFPEENKLSAVLGIRLRKPGEKYNSEIIEKRMSLFKTAKITDVYPIVNFFFLKEKAPQILMQTFSQVLELSHQQQEQNEDLEKNGVGGKPLSVWQLMMLRKLNKSYKQILTQCSLIYHSALTNQMQKEMQKENVK
tara:strand:+ start:919 stop:1686 length:768 start_codon:yes stop_codon:yes gene_type:complete